MAPSVLHLNLNGTQAAGRVCSGDCSTSRPCPAVLLAAPEQSQPHVCSLAQMPVGLRLSQKKQSREGLVVKPDIVNNGRKQLIKNLFRGVLLNLFVACVCAGLFLLR